MQNQRQQAVAFIRNHLGFGQAPTTNTQPIKSPANDWTRPPRLQKRPAPKGLKPIFKYFFGQPNQPGPLFTTPKVIIPLRVTCSVISKFERNQKKPGFTAGLFVPFKTH